MSHSYPNWFLHIWPNSFPVPLSHSLCPSSPLILTLSYQVKVAKYLLVSGQWNATHSVGFPLTLPIEAAFCFSMCEVHTTYMHHVETAVFCVITENLTCTESLIKYFQFLPWERRSWEHGSFSIHVCPSQSTQHWALPLVTINKHELHYLINVSVHSI
jgi:hypothetical protein